MTVVVALEAVVLAVLAVLVAGLLRAYGTVLRRLHELDGSGRTPDFAVGTPPPRAVEAREEWTAAHDVSGESTAGEIVSARVVGCEHDTVLVFLSSGCSTCAAFWTELARRSDGSAAGLRVLIVTQGPEDESRDAVAALAPPDVDLIMSTEAWRDYAVPGSPYVVYVDGPTGRVRGEGTGRSWTQVRDMVARAGGGAPDKSRRDADQELEVDRALLAAGILPGDPRLYGSDSGPAA